jgi:hypothetical protein
MTLGSYTKGQRALDHNPHQQTAHAPRPQPPALARLSDASTPQPIPRATQLLCVALRHRLVMVTPAAGALRRRQPPSPLRRRTQLLCSIIVVRICRRRALLPQNCGLLQAHARLGPGKLLGVVAAEGDWDGPAALRACDIAAAARQIAGAAAVRTPLAPTAIAVAAVARVLAVAGRAARSCERSGEGRPGRTRGAATGWR